MPRRGVGDFPNQLWVRDRFDRGGAVSPASQPGGATPSDDTPIPAIRVITIGGSRFVALPDLTIPASTANRIVIRGANPKRISLVVSNNDAATPARIGDSTVDATHGVRVAGGGSIRISATGEIYAISEGAAITFSMSEELE